MATLKEWTNTIATWTTIAGAVVGGTMAIYQYIENSTSARVKETLDYLDRFYSPPESTALSSIVDYWVPRADELAARKHAGDAALSVYVVEQFQTGGLADDTTVIASFFDRLHACTCARLCDQGIVKRFFAAPAYDFLGLAYPFIADQRKRDPQFGDSIERLARAQADDARFGQIYCAPAAAAGAPSP